MNAKFVKVLLACTKRHISLILDY